MQHLDNISAKVNDKFAFSDADLGSLDFTRIDDRHFHVLADGVSYRAELVRHDFRRKTFTIKINGGKYDLQLADAYDQMVERLGLSVVDQAPAGDIKAPMPGLVLQLLVETGATVEAGAPLLILEAMKMENVIKAPVAGTVAELPVRQGTAVEKGQLLVKFG